jgi:hypothetical protein
MARPDLTSQQAKILAYFLEHGPFVGDASIFEFTFSPSEREVVAAVRVSVEGEEDIYAVCNLPSGNKNQIFLTVTDGNKQIVSGIIAQVANYSGSHELGFGHTINFSGDTQMEKSGRVAALLLITADSKVLNRIQKKISIGSGDYETFLVVFMDKSEYEVKLNSGLIALFDKMEADSKDKVRFVASTHLC